MRVGICSLCGKLGLRMHLHHFTENDTILLCPTCHLSGILGEHERMGILPKEELLNYIRLVNKYTRNEHIGFNVYTMGMLARARRVSKKDKRSLQRICDKIGIDWSYVIKKQKEDKKKG